ncbi:hypothetical protein AB1A64_00425 [Ruegeria sp. ANG10]|uniref:SMODS domain-containing nucleotidyltransferase n=1 Tax=Ruegeria sp. ANG10 TaxID=3042467 RepID=UPI0034555FBD
MLLSQPSLFSNSVGSRQWEYVTRRFKSIQSNLSLLPQEVEDAETKLGGVIRSVNRAYRNESCVGYYMLAGSWGKRTAIHPPSDIDLLCFLPAEVFHQFNVREGNKPSQLLQHVRGSLGTTYPQTRIRGDGQVVVIEFNSIKIEVVPAFHGQDGGVVIGDTNDGGRWKSIDPNAEIYHLDCSDQSFNGNVRKITRIVKQWKQHCDVPIKSFHIERLVQEALAQMGWGGSNEFWFDWIIRDTFLYMWGRAGGGFYMPGRYLEWIDLGDDWRSKAWTAYERAEKACSFERDNMNLSAGAEWQKIFGNVIPEMVT